MKHVEIMLSDKWRNVKGVSWIGNQSAFSYDFSSIEEDMRDIHGTFASIFETEEYVVLLTDCIACYPIFYKIGDDYIYISDDATSILKKSKCIILHENVQEFLKTGYVTETETIYEGIYTLNPATCVKINKSTGDIEEKNWFKLDYSQSLENKEDNLVQKFDDCLKDVFLNLIDRLSGRTALVPLSGGCDSRTIAVMLYRLGYENVVCFSYGKLDNEESRISRIIAENLGYRWEYIEYNSEIWHELLFSSCYKEYLQYSCRGRSIGCLQALPAILEIRKRCVVADDTVVIPGHTLDFEMGSHLPKKKELWTKKQFEEYILFFHYNLRSTQKSNGNTDKWLKKIPEQMEAREFLAKYMIWEWHNRQSKFIANDVRAYEFAGYSIELPFWDQRVLKFTERLSYEALYGRVFQYDYTKRMIDSAAGICKTYSLPESNNLINSLKSFIPFELKEKIKRIMGKLPEDSNGFYSWISEDQMKEYYKKFGYTFNINTIETDDYIREFANVIQP